MTTGRHSLLPYLLILMAGTLPVLGGFWIGQQYSGAHTAWGAAPPEVQAVMWPEPRPLPGLELTTQHGRPFGLDDFAGHWNFLFFGYLACPDVCPTSLNAMREMRRFYAEHQTSEAMQFIFVSVDPEHDSPEEIREYLAWFDQAMIGLHGDQQTVDQLTSSLAVKAVEHIDDTGYRSIDHTSSVIIVDPAGRMVGALPPPQEPGRMIEQFERLRGYLVRTGI